MPQGWTVVPEATPQANGWTPVVASSAPMVMVNGRPMPIDEYNATQQSAPGQRTGELRRVGDRAEYWNGSQWVAVSPDQPTAARSWYETHGPNRLRAGVSDVAAGNYAKGANELITGGMTTALPVAGPAIGLSRLATGMVLGTAADAVTRPIARAVGATPDQADLAGTVVGTGAAGVGTEPAVGWMRNAASRVEGRAVVNTAARGARAILKPREALLQALDRVIQATNAAKTSPPVSGEVIDGEVIPPRPALPPGPTVHEMPASTLPDPSYVKAVPGEYATRETPPVAPAAPPYDAEAARRANAAADQASIPNWEQGYAALLARRANAVRPDVAETPSTPPSAVPSQRATTPRTANRRTAATTAAPATTAETTLSAKARAEFSKRPPTDAEAAVAETWDTRLTPEQILEQIYKQRQLTASLGTPTPEEAADAAAQRAAESNTRRTARMRRRGVPASEEP